MASRRRQPQSDGGGGGCPDYMMTYGDMMSLLLCFFVIIVSLSKIKEEEMFRAVMDSLKKAFGYSQSPNPVDGQFAPYNSLKMVEDIRDQIRKQNRDKGRQPEKADSERKSQVGRSTTVKNIRDGLMMTVGGMSLFEEGSAKLLPEAREDLDQVARIIKGYRNKVLIRGHTGRKPPPEGSLYADRMALSFARAKAVMQFLVDQGVTADRLNLEACGGHEPVKTHPLDIDGQANNRRVEIVVKDQMVEEFEGE